MKAKVRIAVAIDPDGHWSASGWGSDAANDETVMMDLAVDGLGEGAGEARYWVEAYVDIPVRRAVGEAVEGRVLCSECNAEHPLHNGLCSKLAALHQGGTEGSVG